MAGHDRKRRLRQVAVHYVEVGATDPAGEHAESELTGPGRGRSALLEAKLRSRSVEHHGAHRTSLPAGSRILPETALTLCPAGRLG